MRNKPQLPKLIPVGVFAHFYILENHMKLKLKLGRKAIALTGVAVATAAIAATVFQFDPSITVTTTDPANNAYKAKMGWISYKSATTQPEYDVKAQIMVYADGMPGKQNIYVARSTDNGATWSQQAVTSNGGAALTGVASGYLATNNKPNKHIVIDADKTVKVGVLLSDARLRWLAGVLRRVLLPG